MSLKAIKLAGTIFSYEILVTCMGPLRYMFINGGGQMEKVFQPYEIIPALNLTTSKFKGASSYF